MPFGGICIHRRSSRIGGVCAVAICVSLLMGPALAVPSGVGASELPIATSLTLPVLSRQGLVLPMGDAYAADGLQVGYPSVLVDEGVYKMWYFEVDASYFAQIAYATSSDGQRWTKHGAVLSPTFFAEGDNVAYPSVVRVGQTYWMWYDGFDGATYRIFAATSPDGTNWTKAGVVLDVGPMGSQDAASLAYPFVLDVNGTFHMWYTGLTSFSPPENAAIMLATSTNGLNWTKVGVVLSPGGEGSLDSYNAFAGSVVQDGSTFGMVYAGETAYKTSQLLYAVSTDGVQWEKMGVALASDSLREAYLAQPDLLIQPDGTWLLYYVVRNDTSDLQIYLASGQEAAPLPPPPDQGVRPGALFQPVPGVLAVALITGLGAGVGAGVGVVLGRARARRPR